MKQVWVILFLCLCSIALPQQVRPYPGAKIDEAATTEAQSAAAGQPGVEVTVSISPRCTLITKETRKNTR
jgi:hypothetical protein